MKAHQQRRNLRRHNSSLRNRVEPDVDAGPPPRPLFKTLLRAVLATGLLIAGAASLTLQGVPRLHHALTSTQPPVAMTCLELFRDGPPPTAMVHLVDASVVLPGRAAGGWIDDLPEPIAKAIGPETLANWARRWGRGQIVPQNTRLRDRASPLVLPIGTQLAVKADQQARLGEGLVVVVHRNHWRLAARRTLTALGLPIAKSLGDQADPRYILDPLDPTMSLAAAAVSLAVGGIAFVLGLMLAMSLRSGLWIFAVPLTGLITLATTPIRRPARRFSTAAIRMTLGATLIAVAYYLIVNRGGLATSLADPVAITAGMLVALMGLAVCLRTLNAFIPALHEIRQLTGGWPSARSGQPLRSSARPGGTQHNPASTAAVSGDASIQSKLTPGQGLPAALKQRLGEPAGGHARRYVDTRLRVLDGPQLADEVAAQSELLQQLSFDSPLVIEVRRCGGEFAAALQLGCQNWIFATTSTPMCSGRVQDATAAIRLASVLADGRLVMTIADDENLLGSAACDVGILHATDRRMAPEVLAEHLSQIESAAAAGGAGPVSLDASEWRDVLMYADRCAAAIRHASGQQRFDITEAGFGRFFYPPQPVPEESHGEPAAV